MDDAIDLEQKKVLNRKKANPILITNSETIITQRVRGKGGILLQSKVEVTNYVSPKTTIAKD